MSAATIEASFPSLDLNTLLAVHAVLRGRPAIPRVFLPDDILFRRTPSTLLRHATACLTDNISSTESLTYGLVRQTGATPASLEQMDRQTGRLLTQVIEELLNTRYGPGILHYEYARFTPFTYEDIAARLLKYDNWRGEDSLLMQKLIERSTQKVQYIQTYIHLRASQQSSVIFEDVYKTKAETLWQSSWLPHTAYDVGTEDERLLKSLIIRPFERPCYAASVFSPCD